MANVYLTETTSSMRDTGNSNYPINQTSEHKNANKHGLNSYGQIETLAYTKIHQISANLKKCDKKIVKYDLAGLRVWKALTSFSHTIVGDSVSINLHM